MHKPMGHRSKSLMVYIFAVLTSQFPWFSFYYVSFLCLYSPPHAKVSCCCSFKLTFNDNSTFFPLVLIPFTSCFLQQLLSVHVSSQKKTIHLICVFIYFNLIYVKRCDKKHMFLRYILPWRSYWTWLKWLSDSQISSRSDDTFALDIQRNVHICAFIMPAWAQETFFHNSVK